MEALADLIAKITEFMRYFAPGYLFLSAINFSACIKREEKLEYLLISCITLSFVLSTISGVIVQRLSINAQNEQLLLIVLSVFSGLTVGRVRSTGWANKWSDRLFQRSFSDNLFVELKKTTMDSNRPNILVRFAKKNDPHIYEGQILHILYPEKEPVLVLVYYVCRDGDNNIIFDRSSVEGAKMLVNYADIQTFEYFEITPESVPEESEEAEV